MTQQVTKLKFISAPDHLFTESYAIRFSDSMKNSTVTFNCLPFGKFCQQ